MRVVVDHSAGTTTWYTYDELGQVKNIQNQAISTTVDKDVYGRVSSVTMGLDSYSIQTNYTYSNFHSDELASEMQYEVDCPGYIETIYTRDELGRPTETLVLAGDNGYKTVYTYQPRQTRTWVQGGGAIVASVEPQGLIIPPISGHWETTDVGTTSYLSSVSRYSIVDGVPTNESYENVDYDANGNITQLGTTKYVYDNLNRLVRENNLGIDKTITWCYDVGGNILSRTEYAYTTGDLAGVTPTNTYTYTYGNSWKDQLTSFNGQNISYDQAGNPTTYKGATLTWTRGRLLASYRASGGNYTTTMQYDANGIRKQKLIPSANYTTTTEYLYSGNNLLRETIAQGNAGQVSTKHKTYLYNSQGVIGFVYQGVTYTYRKNLFGDIVAIYQGATKVAEYAYDAWGNCLVIDPATGLANTSIEFIGNQNPFRYRGYYWDNDLQLYYLMSRYYDPQTGRFINADSLEYLDPETIGGLNLYAYCGNNPVMHIDPTGYSWDWDNFNQALKYIITGVSAIVAGALVIASGIASLPMLIIAGVTIAAGVLTTVNGIAEVGDLAFNYNFMEDGLFGGNSSAYDTYAAITGTIATVGSIVCGKWYKYNAPRIRAYKNIGSAEFPGNYYDKNIKSRPYFDSVLTQKNIIKYGEMSKSIGKNGKLFYTFTIKGSSVINGAFNSGTYELTLTSDYRWIWHLLFIGD